MKILVCVSRFLVSSLLAGFLSSCGSTPQSVPVVPTPNPSDSVLPVSDQLNSDGFIKDPTTEIYPDVNTQTNTNDNPLAAHEYVDGYPLARKVPGRNGYVFNPYTQNMVDVAGIPQLTKVMDPDDPEKEEHVFRVPRD